MTAHIRRYHHVSPVEILPDKETWESRLASVQNQAGFAARKTPSRIPRIDPSPLVPSGKTVAQAIAELTSKAAQLHDMIAILKEMETV